MSRTNSLSISALFLLVAGCSIFPRDEYFDVSGMTDKFPELKNSYRVGASYETQIPLVILSGGRWDYLDKPQVLTSGGERYRRQMVGALEKGVKLSITKLELRNAASDINSGVAGIAEVQDGQFRGRTVKLGTLVSIPNFRTVLGMVPIPDSRIMRLVGDRTDVGAPNTSTNSSPSPKLNSKP